MIRFLMFLVLIVGLLAVDASAFDGHYGRTAWQEAKDQGQKLQYNVDYWLRKLRS